MNTTAIAKADTKLGGNLAKQFPDAISRASALIDDAKAVIGLNLVFRLVIKSCHTDDTLFDTMEKRAAAATEVKTALQKFRIEMAEKTVSLLNDFVTA